MKRAARTGSTLLFGAGFGALLSRLLCRGGRQDEDERPGVLSRVPVIPVPGVPTVHASELTVSPEVSCEDLTFSWNTDLQRE